MELAEHARGQRTQADRIYCQNLPPLTTRTTSSLPHSFTDHRFTRSQLRKYAVQPVAAEIFWPRDWCDHCHRRILSGYGKQDFRPDPVSCRTLLGHGFGRQIFPG